VSAVVSNENVNDATGKHERPLLTIAIAQSRLDNGVILMSGTAMTTTTGLFST
jgi:hypothetical protein